MQGWDKAVVTLETLVVSLRYNIIQSVVGLQEWCDGDERCLLG